MSTITNEQAQRITDFLATHDLPSGLGNEESACSIASINLALTGRLTDDIPQCMSEVIGKWIIVVQDAMPAEMRNGRAWKALLPMAAGTGRERESERLAIILDWMWRTALPSLQQLADKYGFGGRWDEMCELKTSDAADAARAAARAAAAYVAAAYVADAADAARAAAARAADAARAAARAVARADARADAAYAADAADAADAAGAAGAAATRAADAAYAAYAADAADAADAARAARAADAAWQTFNPCEILRKLIELK